MKRNNILKLVVLLFFIVTNVFYIFVKGEIKDILVREVSFNEYLNLVKNNNLEYLSEKYNVKIAEAEAISERVFPDPELTVEFTDNGEFYKNDELGYVVAFGLDYTLELGRKRGARIRLANSQAELSSIVLEHFFHELRADATDAFLEAMRQRELYEVKKASYEYMSQFYLSDSIRHKLGEISEIDVRQSKVEAISLLNEVYQQEADYKSSLVQLNRNIGLRSDSIIFLPVGRWLDSEVNYHLDGLYALAMQNRSDYMAAIKNDEVAANQLKLVRAERKIDLGLSVGLEINSKIRNEGAETCAFNAIMAGVTIPLKFSNRNKGALNAAKYEILQAQAERQNIELNISAEVAEAFFNYEAAKKQLHQFKSGMIEDAEKLLEGVDYMYKRGETSILDVLIAQRTYNEIQEQYIDARKDFAGARVELEKACGIWDIEF